MGTISFGVISKTIAGRLIRRAIWGLTAWSIQIQLPWGEKVLSPALKGKKKLSGFRSNHQEMKSKAESLLEEYRELFTNASTRSEFRYRNWNWLEKVRVQRQILINQKSEEGLL